MISLRTSPSLLLLSDRVCWTTGGRWAKHPALRAWPPPRTVEPPPDFKELLDLACENMPAEDTLDVVLGARWTRLDLVALPKGRLTDDESATLVEACRARFLADRGDAPELIVQPQKLPGQLLVAAIDRPLCNALRTALGRIRVRSIQPLLGWLSDGRFKFRLRDGWIAVREPGQVTIGHLTRGYLDSLRMVRTGETPTDLAQLIRRQSAGSGLPLGDTEVVSLVETPLPPPEDWKHRWLSRMLGG